MTITYVYFRGNKVFNKGRLSKVHAFSDKSSGFFPICCTDINRYDGDKITIIQKDIQIDDLCKLCQKELLVLGITWFNDPSDFDATKAIPVKRVKNDSRGGSVEVEINSEVTKVMNYNLGGHKIIVTIVNEKYSSSTIRLGIGGTTTALCNKDSLLRLFIITYKALKHLDLLSDELVQNFEQFLFKMK